MHKLTHLNEKADNQKQKCRTKKILSRLPSLVVLLVALQATSILAQDPNYNQGPCTDRSGDARGEKTLPCPCSQTTEPQEAYDAGAPPAPIVLLLPSPNQGEIFAETIPEVVPPNSTIDIHPIPNCTKMTAITIEVIDPQGNPMYHSEIFPIASGKEYKKWPKISLNLIDVGSYKVKASFLGAGGEIKTASSSILVNDGKPYAKTDTVSEDSVCPQILGKILDELEKDLDNDNTNGADSLGSNWQPPYSRQELMETIKDFFKQASQDEFSPAQSAQRAKLIDLSNAIDSHEEVRWVVQSLPLWKDVEDRTPPALLAQKTAQLSRPDDLALLANLIDCEIGEGAQQWGLSILSQISNPINTDFLEALVLEDLYEINEVTPENQDWSKKDSAIEALTKMGSPRSIRFLVNLLEQPSTIIDNKEKERIKEKLFMYLPTNQTTLQTLQGILGEKEGELDTVKETLLDLVNLLEGQALENTEQED
jgi:hypothetical protein